MGNCGRCDNRTARLCSGKGDKISEVCDQNDHKAQNQSTAQRLSEQYKVSPITIKRDAQVAEAIDVLGEASPDAKRNVLSGAAGITKKQLKDLLSGTEEDITKIAVKIEAGPLERRRTAGSAAASDSEAAEHFDAGQSPLETAVKRLTDSFLSKLRGFSGNATAEEQREALKAHITELENLLSQI